MQMFSGFVPNLKSDFKASRNKSEMRDIPLRVTYCTKKQRGFRESWDRAKARGIAGNIYIASL